QRRPAKEFTLPLDGREPLELGDWPAVFVTPKSEATDGFPARGTFHVNLPQDTTLRLTIAGVAESGGALRVLVDGQSAAASAWTHSDRFPATLAVPLRAGARTITIENPGTSDWVHVEESTLGINVPALAAIGRRNDRFIALWVRHRTHLYTLAPAAPASGKLVLEDVPAGTWNVTWWDTAKGTVSASAAVQHAGGTLRLETHPVLRHAAIVLARQP
ncbi:MAG TPA: hypothetical protein VK477_07215, partial [Acidobacteriota bacterium]|nr:hypothetical protein [Acidobacteriota bacterium]